jgi:glutamine synthetase
MATHGNRQVQCLKTEFGIDVFDESKQQECLTAPVFKKLRQLINNGEHSLIDRDLANSIAEGMKHWALSRGATHYTHWFQPLSGITAEKHDSFLGKLDMSGHPLAQFEGSLLLRAEPDASSFPSGGLRSTYHARGYTVWDPVSPAYLLHYDHGSVLYIPTAFISWETDTSTAEGHKKVAASLGLKMPLLRSEMALSKAVVEMLRFLGDNESTHATSSLGCEQEFFVVDRKMFLARRDLHLTGRTLLGAPAQKGQELDDHYFGTIPDKVMTMMQDIEMQLWRLGIPMTTRHNEVAPAQHEFAPVYEQMSVAADHQMLMMNVMTATARKHDLEVLLHEKPFAGVNGSGKHNNWSFCTNKGKNLLQPPDELMVAPERYFANDDNMMFTVFLTAVIKAVDDYQGQLRCSISNHAQDLRLGANEAPPAIVSIYLGDALDNIVKAVCAGATQTEAPAKAELSHVNERLPDYERDQTDRNRTSPFAFTGNKFEFRAVGSSQNVAIPMTAVNSATACALQDMNKEIKKLVEGGQDAKEAVKAVTKTTLEKHLRIVYNGDNYVGSWVEEAERQGLQNWRSTPEAFENVDLKELYVRAGVLSAGECESRKEVALETYVKCKMIEFRCICDMVQKHVFPSVQKTLARLTQASKSMPDGDNAFQAEIEKIAPLSKALMEKLKALKTGMEHKSDTLQQEANHIHKVLDQNMAELRAVADELEELCAAEDWTIPTYTDLLFKQC